MINFLGDVIEGVGMIMMFIVFSVCVSFWISLILIIFKLFNLICWGWGRVLIPVWVMMVLLVYIVGTFIFKYVRGEA